MKPGDELLFLALGGSGEIGMNANLYGCQGKWVMLDLGMSFADSDLPGVDLIFPDMQFIEDRADDLLGIVLTHGHEDHIGAIPWLAADLDVPLYATPFTAGLIRRKLAEQDLLDTVDLQVIERGGSFSLGPFAMRYIPLAHSIAEGNAVLIETPHGRVFHTGDWKLDDTPLVGVPSTPEELGKIGDEGVLALICDSTNVFNEAESGSESDVREALIEEIAPLTGRVVVATFASNVARLQTLGQVAEKCGRRLCVAGRSLDRIIENANQHGYLLDLPPLVDFDKAMSLPRRELMVMATGGQGEPRAALARMAQDNHPISLERGDHVLFSSKQIPGNDQAIARVQNAFAERGVEMITDRQADIHVSGHPGRPELRAMYGWLKPEIVIPVHGEMRHMAEQGRLAQSCGYAALVQKNGDLVRLAPGKPEIIGQQESGRLALDGDVIIPAWGETMSERRKISCEGVISVAIALDEDGNLLADPQLQCTGIPLEEEEADFIEEAQENILQSLSDSKMPTHLKNASPADVFYEKIRLAVRRTATRWTGKKPRIHVLIFDSLPNSDSKKK